MNHWDESFGYEMKDKPTYQIGFQMYRWHVGYHIEFDEIFIYRVDSDQLVWTFRKGGIDSVGFEEFMDFSKTELLGEL